MLMLYAKLHPEPLCTLRYETYGLTVSNFLFVGRVHFCIMYFIKWLLNMMLAIAKAYWSDSRLFLVIAVG
jgi:hypothetical protein